MKVELYAPESYINASEDVRRIVANGCGPGGWKVDLVPDSIIGCNIKPACNIHDWMYALGLTLADKAEADRVLLNNILRIIKAHGGHWLLQHFRRRLARGYYEAVENFGGPAFWQNKNGYNILLEVAL